MSSASSRDKQRLFSRGNSLYSFDSTKDFSSYERSLSTPTNIQQSISTPSHIRSESGMILNRRSEHISTPKSSKAWLNTRESTDLGVVPEDIMEDMMLPTSAIFPSFYDMKEGGQNPSQPVSREQQVWYEIRDVKSKKLFYFEAVSQVSQWNRPEGVTIIPINQRGVAIILGNGVIEKNYATASARMANREFVNQDEHIFDPIEHTKSQIFPDIDAHSSISTPLTEDITPTNDAINEEDHLHSYKRYVETHFNYYRRGLFKTRTTFDRITSFKPEPIHRPLLRAASEYGRESVELNKQILQYVSMASNVNTTGRLVDKEFEIIREILRIVMENYQGLRDEVYCQVLKVKKSAGELVVMAAWDLLAVLCATIAPTEVLMPHILNECLKARSNKNYRSLPKLAGVALKKTMVLKPRDVIPTNVELNAILNDEYVSIRVHLYNGNYLMMRIKAGITVHAFQHMIAEKLHLVKHESLFCLAESRSDGYERKCDADEQVLVILSRWQTHYDTNHKTNLEYHFVYRCFQFVDFDRTDAVMLEMMFIQCCADMKRLLYPCTEVDLITLLALYIKSIHGDNEITDKQYMAYFEEFVPVIQRNYVLLDKLHQFCKRLKRRERKWYMCAYIDYVMNWELYGIVCFPVETIGRTDMRQNSILAIGMHGVFILQPETKLIQREIPFDAIPCWGYTKETIILYVGSFVHQEKMIFGTKDGKVINDLLQNYVTYLTEQLETQS